jgi:hypothetical protein
MKKFILIFLFGLFLLLLALELFSPQIGSINHPPSLISIHQNAARRLVVEALVVNSMRTGPFFIPDTWDQAKKQAPNELFNFKNHKHKTILHPNIGNVKRSDSEEPIIVHFCESAGEMVLIVGYADGSTQILSVNELEKYPAKTSRFFNLLKSDDFQVMLYTPNNP